MKLTACSKANLHASVNTSNMCCIISFSKSLLSLGLCPRPLARDGCGQGVWGWPSPTLAHPAHWTESSITQSRLLGGNLSSVSHTYHHPRSLVGILKKNDSTFLAIALTCAQFSLVLLKMCILSVFVRKYQFKKLCYSAATPHIPIKCLKEFEITL